MEEGKRLGAEGGEGLRVLWVSLLLRMLAEAACGPMLPYFLTEDLGADALSLGWSVSLSAAAQMGASLALGSWGDVGGSRKKAFLATLASGAASSFLCGFSKSLRLWFVARALAGVSGAAGSVAQALVAESCKTQLLRPPREERQLQARLSGLCLAADSAGLVLGEEGLSHAWPSAKPHRLLRRNAAVSLACLLALVECRASVGGPLRLRLRQSAVSLSLQRRPRGAVFSLCSLFRRRTASRPRRVSQRRCSRCRCRRGGGRGVAASGDVDGKAAADPQVGRRLSSAACSCLFLAHSNRLFLRRCWRGLLSAAERSAWAAAAAAEDRPRRGCFAVANGFRGVLGLVPSAALPPRLQGPRGQR